MDIPDLQADITETTGEDESYIGEKEKRSSQCRTDISVFIAEVERYGISDRAASALYNAALIYNGIVTDECKDKVVDKYKIRRGREPFRVLQGEKKQAGLEEQGGLGCLGVDGKRDKKSRKIITCSVDGEVVEKKVVGSEEHLSYTVEPEGEYLTHTVIPSGKGTGYDLSQDFMDVLREYKSVDSLVAIVCDGTPVNTGWRDGFL